MKIVLFFNPLNSLIGIYDNKGGFVSSPLTSFMNNFIAQPFFEIHSNGKTSVFQIPSKYLFQNSQYFRERFINLVYSTVPDGNKIGIDQLTMAVGGYISQDGSILVNSELLNQISLTDAYDGINIKKVFGTLVKQNNVRFINDCRAVCAGIDALQPFIGKPCLVMFIHKKVDFAIIDENGIAEVLPIGNWAIEDMDNRDANYLLGSIGIDEILQSDEIEINMAYTSILGNVISHYYNYFSQLKRTFKTLYIFSEHDYLINRRELAQKFNNINFSYPKDTKEKLFIQIEGALRISSFPNRTAKVTKVEYWGHNQLINTFTNKEELTGHWKMWGMTASPLNTYRVFGSKGLINIYRLSDIKHEFIVNSIFN